MWNGVDGQIIVWDQDEEHDEIWMNTVQWMIHPSSSFYRSLESPANQEEEEKEAKEVEDAEKNVEGGKKRKMNKKASANYDLYFTLSFLVLFFLLLLW